MARPPTASVPPARQPLQHDHVVDVRPEHDHQDAELDGPSRRGELLRPNATGGTITSSAASAVTRDRRSAKDSRSAVNATWQIGVVSAHALPQRAVGDL